MSAEFNHGAIIAISVLIATHDSPTIAAEVVHAMGLARYDCSRLDEYDKQNLRKLVDEPGIDFTGLRFN